MKKKFIYILLTCILLVQVGVIATPVYAANSDVLVQVEDVEVNNSLTNYLRDRLKGQQKWLDKTNFIAGAVSVAISVGGALILSGEIFTKVMTVVYLSLRSSFDRIDEVKREGINAGGTIIDKAIRAVMFLIPNIKEVSEFGSRSALKLSGDAGFMEWALKVIPGSLLTILFAVLMYNGQISMIYAETVDAIVVVADSYEELNLENVVRSFLNTDIGDSKYTVSDAVPIDRLRKEMYVVLMRTSSRILETSNKEIMDSVSENITNRLDNLKALSEGKVEYKVVKAVQGKGNTEYCFATTSNLSDNSGGADPVLDANGGIVISESMQIITEMYYYSQAGERKIQLISNSSGGPLLYTDNTPVNIYGYEHEDPSTGRIQFITSKLPRVTKINSLPSEISINIDPTTNLLKATSTGTRVTKTRDTGYYSVFKDTNNNGYFEVKEVLSQIKPVYISSLSEPEAWYNHPEYFGSVKLSNYSKDKGNTKNLHFKLSVIQK